jgi:two-component system, NtrC family, nitrogen regulation response regulator NtrX
VGGSRTIQVDVRVIAATNKDLEAEIEKGRFRDDLYYRLNVIPIRVPPLRERVEDIPALVSEFLGEISMNMNVEPKRFSGEALEKLRTYPWPGNIRELKNLVERLAIMTPGMEILAADIPAHYSREEGLDSAFASSLAAATIREAKESFEKAYLAKKLQEYKWNISQTADAIGIERSNLHKKIKAYGLEPDRSP